jgi:hypothetical protein
MNEGLRQMIFIIAIPTIIAAGTTFLGMSYGDCLLLLALGAIVMKLTDIQDTIAGKI